MTNFIVGFFIFLKRLLVLVGFGFLFISRLDKAVVPRGYEAFDPGFACYQVGIPLSGSAIARALL